MSGKRHTIATAWNAPIDAPADQISMSGVLQSFRIAGTTSCFTYWWNWFCSHIWWRAFFSRLMSAAPATLSHE